MLEEAGTPPAVVEHCETVARIALRVGRELQARGFQVDLELVEAGALLHDIGRSRSHEVDHVAWGVKIGRELGLDERVVRIIMSHVGAGIPPEEAAELGLPPWDYIPRSLEEKVVAYADKLAAGRCEVDMEKTIKEFERKLGRDHPSVERLRRLDREMKSLLSQPPDKVLT